MYYNINQNIYFLNLIHYVQIEIIFYFLIYQFLKK